MGLIDRRTADQITTLFAAKKIPADLFFLEEGSDGTPGVLTPPVARILGVTLGSSDGGVAEAALLNELATEAVLDVRSRTRVYVRHASVALTGGIDEFDFDPYVLRVFGFLRG